jgi:hypothetical protein
VKTSIHSLIQPTQQPTSHLTHLNNSTTPLSTQSTWRSRIDLYHHCRSSIHIYTGTMERHTRTTFSGLVAILTILLFALVRPSTATSVAYCSSQNTGADNDASMDTFPQFLDCANMASILDMAVEWILQYPMQRYAPFWCHSGG